MTAEGSQVKEGKLTIAPVFLPQSDVAHHYNLSGILDSQNL